MTTNQEETTSKANERNTQESILSTLSLIKKILFSLLLVMLMLSTAFNLYLSYHNRRLNEALDFYTAQVQKLSMRDQTLDRLFRDLVSFSEDNPELKKILNKYHILLDEEETSAREKKADAALEDLIGQE